MDTHTLHNEVTLVWGSLRLAPISTLVDVFIDGDLYDYGRMSSLCRVQDLEAHSKTCYSHSSSTSPKVGRKVAPLMEPTTHPENQGHLHQAVQESTSW